MKKPLLVILLCFFCLPILAQQRWGGGVDYDKIHFGFSFHYVSSSFKVFSTQKTISSPLRAGVGLGLLSNLNLTENASLRFSPTILFADKQINYTSPDILEKSVKASLLELPLTFKFRSDRRKNYRIYALGGGKYSQNVKKRIDESTLPPSEKEIKLKSGFFSYEFGLGVDIYFEYFKMSPEIKWSQSFGSVLDKRELNDFNTPVGKLLLRSVQFSLIFE